MPRMTKTEKTRTRKEGTEAEIVLPEVEHAPEQGSLIDGTEDDITELERDTPAPIAADVGSDTVPQAVAAAARAAKKATATKKVEVEPMAETISKAEMIRNEIAARKAASNEKIRPCDIVTALAGRGVKVHAPQVSVALRDFGKAGKPRKADATPKSPKEGKRVLARVKPGVTPKPTPAATTTGPNYAELMAAGQFVTGLGGIDKARAMLDAYAVLLNPAK